MLFEHSGGISIAFGIMVPCDGIQGLPSAHPWRLHAVLLGWRRQQDGVWGLEDPAELWTVWSPQAGAVSGQTRPGPRKSGSQPQQAPLSQAHVTWAQSMLTVAR